MNHRDTPLYGFSFQRFTSVKRQSGRPRLLIDLCTIEKKKNLFITDLKCTSSLRNTLPLLTSMRSNKHSAVGQLGFILHTITGLHRPSLTYYYGFICHLTPTSILSLLLIDASGICPDVVPGFPSYCTDALLTMPPSSTL